MDDGCTLCYKTHMNAFVHYDLPRRAWLTIEDFLRLDGTSAFEDFAKTELIDGEILCMNAQYMPHAFAKAEIAFRLRQALAASALPLLKLLTEVAIAMPPFDMPEPDIVLTDAPIRDGAVPLASVFLIVEIADTTRTYDLGRKAQVYARHRVPEYWVVDMEKNRIVRHIAPGTSGYEAIDEIAFGERLPSLTIVDLTIDTDAIDPR